MITSIFMNGIAMGVKPKLERSSSNLPGVISLMVTANPIIKNKASDYYFSLCLQSGDSIYRPDWLNICVRKNKTYQGISK